MEVKVCVRNLSKSTTQKELNALPENDFQWQYGTLASTQISKGEIGIGIRFRTTGHFMDRRYEENLALLEGILEAARVMNT